MSRSRNSLNTLKSKPLSSSSSPKAYFQSMRPRTASAACRSESPSPNCITVTSIKRHALQPGCPSREYTIFQSAASNIPPNSSRMCIYWLPFGKAACAIRLVSSGIAPTSDGPSDMPHLISTSTFPPFSLSLPLRQQYQLEMHPEPRTAHAPECDHRLPGHSGHDGEFGP